MDRDDSEEERLLREEAAALERDAHGLEDTAHRMEDRAHELVERAEELAEEHRHHGEHHHDEGHHHQGHGGHHHDGRVKFIIVVNGKPTTVEAGADELMGTVRQQALTQTENLAQPAESWELKNEAGEPIAPDRTVGSYGFHGEVTLFLSLAAGVAGA